MAIDPNAGLCVRPLGREDSLEELTQLIHRAYRPLADAGFRYWASHQDAAATARRAAEGDCLLAVLGGRVVGTITLRDAEQTKGSPWYDRPDVASFGQFAVAPEVQGRGIGKTLLEFVERRALEKGVAELALDTAEGATRLVETYTRRGYRFIEFVDWRPQVNYRSVILSKRLIR